MTQKAKEIIKEKWEKLELAKKMRLEVAGSSDGDMSVKSSPDSQGGGSKRRRIKKKKSKKRSKKKRSKKRRTRKY